MAVHHEFIATERSQRWEFRIQNSESRMKELGGLGF
jgi:hypothetical protein